MQFLEFLTSLYAGHPVTLIPSITLVSWVIPAFQIIYNVRCIEPQGQDNWGDFGNNYNKNTKK